VSEFGKADHTFLADLNMPKFLDDWPTQENIAELIAQWRKAHREVELTWKAVETDRNPAVKSPGELKF
jgi:hypothetical protein